MKTTPFVLIACLCASMIFPAATARADKDIFARDKIAKGLEAMRKAYGALIDAERDGKPETENLRKALAGQYEAFRAAHGPSANAMAFRVKDAGQALQLAIKRGAKPVTGPVGPSTSIASAARAVAMPGHNTRASRPRLGSSTPLVFMHPSFVWLSVGRSMPHGIASFQTLCTLAGRRVRRKRRQHRTVEACGPALLRPSMLGVGCSVGAQRPRSFLILVT